MFFQADVTREKDIIGMIACARERFGRLDCLFDNAGDSRSGFGIEEITEDAFNYDMMLLARLSHRGS